MPMVGLNDDGMNEESTSTSLGSVGPQEDQMISYGCMSHFLQASSKIPFRNLSTRKTNDPISSMPDCFFYLRAIITMFLSNMTIRLHLRSLPSSLLSCRDLMIFFL